MINIQPNDASNRWISEAPSVGRRSIRVRAQDHRGLYVIPFLAEFKSGRWFNEETGEELDCHVAGWIAWDPTANASPQTPPLKAGEVFLHLAIAQ
jgi:hypothetical protein